MSRFVPASWKRCRQYTLSADAPLKVHSAVSAWEAPASGQCLLVLCDYGGIVRGMSGPSRLRRLAHITGLQVGCHLGEPFAGPNAVGTAMVEGQRAEVAGDEHLLAALRRWHAAAVPVTHSGRAVAYASAWWEAGTEAGAAEIQQTLDLGTAACRARWTAHQADWLAHILNEAAGPLRAYLVADQAGEVLLATPGAARLLGAPDLKDLSLSMPFLWQQAQRTLSAGGQTEFQVRPPAVPGARTVSVQRMPGETTLALITVEAADAGPQMASRLRTARYQFADVITVSPNMQATLQMARSAAATDTPIVLLGESGTGKELVAQSIHLASQRAQGPFVAVNCAAFPRELVVSELFGYEDGAFTGARRQGAPGRFEQAHGGTLFLDEIGEMALEHQALLLRVLEEGLVTRLGGSRPHPADVRIITATNRDLHAEVQQGRFRADLYYRLNIMPVRLPPLRERADDIALLATTFLEREGRSVGKQLALHPEALAELRRYQWPGNIRELHNVVKRAAILATGHTIGPADLPWNEYPAPTQPRRRVRAAEIESVLAGAGGNVSEAARQLGVARSTIYRIRRRNGS